MVVSSFRSVRSRAQQCLVSLDQILDITQLRLRRLVQQSNQRIQLGPSPQEHLGCRPLSRREQVRHEDERVPPFVQALLDSILSQHRSTSTRRNASQSCTSGAMEARILTGM